VALVPNEHGWSYLLPDALSPGKENSLQHAAELLERVQHGESLTRKQRYVLMNVLHYVRIVNGLSMACGLEERVLIPGVKLPTLSAHLPTLFQQIKARKNVY
jgi:hypothetical protein